MLDNQETVQVDNSFYIDVPKGFQAFDNADEHLVCIETGRPYYFVMNKGQCESEVPDIMYQSEVFIGIYKKIEHPTPDCRGDLSLSVTEWLPNRIRDTYELSVAYAPPSINDEFASLKFGIVLSSCYYIGVFRLNGGGHTVDEVETTAKALLGTINIGEDPDDSFFFADNDDLLEYLGDAQEVIIPRGTRNIEPGAFFHCSMTSVVIPEGVDSIKENAFQECDISSITFLSSVPKICCAFSDCTNLESVYFSDWESFLNMSDYNSCEEERTWGNADVYINGEMLTDKIVIPDGVTRIGEGVFHHWDITSITIPNSVTSIGSCALSDCTGLTSITIPESVTSIGSGAFMGCEHLESVYFNDLNSFLSIDFEYDEPGWEDVNYYFNGELVKDIVIPDGMTSIGCFYGCISLESITIPDSVKTVSEESFYYCKNLKSLHLNFSDLNSFLNIDRITGTYGSWLDNVDYYIDGELLTELTIPEDVTKIEEYAFSGCKSLQRVTISNSVISIEGSAFSGCKALESVHFSNLTSVLKMSHDGWAGWKDVDYYIDGELLTDLTVPEGITTINNRAFEECRSLKSIKIPDSVTSIGNHAFKGCTSLTSIMIPKGVVKIGEQAFCGCKSLESIKIPDSVTSIGDHAFEGCTSLTSIMIPKGVVKIGEQAFRGCKSLESVTIPSSVTSIGEDAFGGCSSLERITNPEILKLYPKDAFNKCEALERVYFSDLTSVFKMSHEGRNCWKDVDYYIDGELLTDLIVPEEITTINDHAFEGCRSLVNIMMPTSVTSIGNHAFKNCSNLASIMIPESVTKIGDDAFAGCKSLERVNFSDVTRVCGILYNRYPDWKDVDYYIDGKLLTELTSPEDVTNIEAYAFSGCKSLVSITMLEGVTSIDKYAFYGCSNLTSITLPASVRYIAEGAFAGCESLERVYFSDISSVCGILHNRYPGWKDVDYYIDGKLLTELTIPESVVHIGDHAFEGCRSLKSITIPNSVTSIYDYTFYGCSNLVSITIPEGVTSIQGYAFYGCSNLTGITIPNSVRSIDEYAFYGCSNLASIIIPDSVLRIGGYHADENTFKKCDNLIIHAHSPSCAEVYAKTNNIPFETID